MVTVTDNKHDMSCALVDSTVRSCTHECKASLTHALLSSTQTCKIRGASLSTLGSYLPAKIYERTREKRKIYNIKIDKRIWDPYDQNI